MNHYEGKVQVIFTFNCNTKDAEAYNVSYDGSNPAACFVAMVQTDIDSGYLLDIVDNETPELKVIDDSIERTENE